MAIVQGAPKYACYARWLVGATQYAVGTDEALRDGIWHPPYLRRDTALAERFMQGASLEARGFDLVIADQLLGSFQMLVAGGGIDGIAVTVECVCTVLLSDGTTDTQTRTQVLSIRGARNEPGAVVITLIDHEDTKLQALYPPELWRADIARDIAQVDTGIAIAHPVGTARKLRAALLLADATTPQYWYGVCEAPLQTLAITAISTGSKTFTVAGDRTSTISAGTVIFSAVGSANPGRYSVVSAVYGGVNTVITVSEAIGSATVSGNLLVPPTVLAVYRDGRVVNTSEYTVELSWPATTQLPDPDFDGSPASWSASGTGTGTAALTGGVGRMTGDGGTANYGSIVNSETAAELQTGAWALVSITLATAGKVRLYYNAIAAGFCVLAGIGRHTGLIQCSTTSGARRARVSSYGTGYSGTVDVDDIAFDTTHRLLLIRFVREQVGFDGNAHVIECDVRGVESRNAVDEISRVLTAAGCTPDATSFATASAYATTSRMLVDCDHGALVSGDGGSSGQRTIAAILADLAFIARASLPSRNAAGQYVIVQDKTGTSSASYSESDGDLLALASVTHPPRPSTLAISYSPKPADPARTAHTIERAVTGGVLGDQQPRVVRYLTDSEAADRLLCYLALRAQYARIARGKLMLVSHALGDVVTFTSPPVGLYSPTPMTLRSVRQMPAGIEIEALEYDANVHTYTPADYPAGASDSYQPDYSHTAPAAPTALTITAGSTALASDGNTVARITVTAVAPSVNFAELWLWAIHNTTGEITGLVRAEIVSGSTYGGTLTGLRPGETYQLKADASNSFGIRSLVPATFNATAIGGSGAATTFVAPGYATAPATVSSCTAAQGMGRLIRVTWANVTTANLANYVLERSVNAAAYAEVARPNSTSYTDTDVQIASVYQYRVKARDRFGNVSASYATSGTVTPTGNIVGGSSGNDIGSNTVDPSNRAALTSVSVTLNSTDVVTMSASEGRLVKTVAHALGKRPVIGGAIFSGFQNITCHAANPTTTTVDIVFVGQAKQFTKVVGAPGFSAAYTEAELDGHQHEVEYNLAANGDTGTLYIG